MRYKIEPCAKPRMTKSDSWKKRPAVMKYWAFKDEIKRNKVTYDNYQAAIFRIKMPKSWSMKKKNLHRGKPHTQRPDTDNLLKALMDAIHGEDSHLWCPFGIKVWDDVGSIEILHLAAAMAFVESLEE